MIFDKIRNGIECCQRQYGLMEVRTSRILWCNTPKSCQFQYETPFTWDLFFAIFFFLLKHIKTEISSRLMIWSELCSSDEAYRCFCSFSVSSFYFFLWANPLVFTARLNYERFFELNSMHWVCVDLIVWSRLYEINSAVRVWACAVLTKCQPCWCDRLKLRTRTKITYRRPVERESRKNDKIISLILYGGKNKWLEFG